MYILLLFSFLAGIVTVLSPCILPVLPLLLSAGVDQGRKRPYGIIIGLIISFTFFTLALTTIVHATGVSPNILRYLAIGLIIFFGLTMIFGRLDQWFSQKTSAIAQLGQSLQARADNAGTGFWSGFILGAALGLIWAPCAGPILATITTLVATNAITLSTILVTLAYSLGTALPMFLIMYGGNKIVNSTGAIAAYSEIIRKVFGILMIAGALAIAFHFDVYLQQIAIKYFPMITVDNNELVKKELDRLATNPQVTTPIPQVGHAAPEFVGISQWINSEPLSLAELRNKAILVDFWTYSCINCVRTLPYIKKWYQAYKDKGLVVVGIHTPEFEFEKNLSNVKNAVQRFEITYPVALDNNYKTWQNFHNRFWPAHYLIDQNGKIQYMHAGEGNYLETENAIRKLLNLELLAEKEKIAAAKMQTPETYLGSARASAYNSEIALKAGQTIDYTYHKELTNDQVGIKGSWFVDAEYIKSQSDNSILNLNFIGSHVYLVISSQTPATISLLLDGKPLNTKYYTADSNNHGNIVVKDARMYDLVDLKGDYGRHLLSLQVPKDVSLYAFTFGN